MRFIYLVIVAIIFASCMQKRYLHNAAAVMNPMFKKQGDGYAGVHYSSNGENLNGVNGNEATSKTGGIAVQGGYATGRHFGIAGSFDYMHQHDNYDSLWSEPFRLSVINYNRTCFTLAGTYFHTNTGENVGINLLFGVIAGKVDIKDAGKLAGTNYSRYFQSNSLSVFVQPSLNFYTSEYSGLGVSTRFGYFTYGNNQTNYTPGELQALRLDHTSPLYVAELGLKGQIGIGREPLSLDAQLNYIYSHSGRVHVKRANLALGLSYHFSRKRKD